MKKKAIDEKEKVCKSCNTLKSTTEFYVQQQKGSNDQIWKYYDSICITCRIEYANIRRKDKKIQAINYKGGKCEQCGYDDISCPDVFDFHHINPDMKDFNIGKTSKSFISIKPELDKCKLLCANCHRKEHSIKI